ncbi:MAG: ATP-binding cassette domain-containing protein [Alphaproteobacteria bacterium]|jgi:ATP-binding cassette subfamily B protein/ATP-binding cassette subfamily C protein LapB|nr:ATP-binding cassette domain-containing protein [Alphaproteobacteria bacterium]
MSKSDKDKTPKDNQKDEATQSDPAQDVVVPEGGTVPMADVDDQAEQKKERPPLEDCVTVLLSFYGIKADIEGILSELPRESGEMTFDDMPAICNKLSLKSDVLKFEAKDLRNLSVPAIVQMKDGSFRIQFPVKTHYGKVYKPGEGLTGETLRDIGENFTGVATIISPLKSDTQTETSHMLRGHALDWFWTPIVSYWPRYAEILVCSFFINIFVVALPLFTLNVYDRVVPNFATSTLIALSAGILLALVFDFIFKTVRAYILERVAARIGSKYDYDLMERLMYIKPQMMRLSVGERSNIFRELQGIRDFYATRLAPTVIDFPFLLLFLLVIFLISPILVVVPVTGALFILAFNLIAQVPNNRANQEYFASMQNKTSLLVETLLGTQSFRMFNAVGSRLFHWEMASTKAAETARRNQFIRATIQNVSMSVMHVVHVFVVFLGVFEIQAGNLTIGGLIACTILSGRSIAPIMGMSNVLANWGQSLDALKTIDKLFQLDHEADSTSSKSPKGPFKGKIEFKDVSFQYVDQLRPAVNKMSMLIQPGEKVGLIGRTGAGKSTTAQLLSGFLDPLTGEIRLDDFSLDAISPAEFRRHVGLVPQKSFFFKGTIYENILMGQESVDEVALKRAIDLSGLDIVIRQSGLGIDMDVGENGDRLSGGQQQAISLARAFLHDPEILIFDEPTNGMDSALENHVKNALAHYIQNKTFIMITHRTTLLPLVNRLIFMDNGQVAADGPRDEILLKLSGAGEGQGE